VLQPVSVSVQVDHAVGVCAGEQIRARTLSATAQDGVAGSVRHLEFQPRLPRSPHPPERVAHAAVVDHHIHRDTFPTRSSGAARSRGAMSSSGPPALEGGGAGREHQR